MRFIRGFSYTLSYAAALITGLFFGPIGIILVPLALTALIYIVRSLTIASMKKEIKKVSDKMEKIVVKIKDIGQKLQKYKESNKKEIEKIEDHVKSEIRLEYNQIKNNVNSNKKYFSDEESNEIKELKKNNDALDKTCDEKFKEILTKYNEEKEKGINNCTITQSVQQKQQKKIYKI